MAVEGFAPPPVSTFADVRALTEDMASGRVKVLFVHAAERLGVQDDDVVRVISGAGEVEAIVYV